jgi:hypothetical protein
MPVASHPEPARTPALLSPCHAVPAWPFPFDRVPIVMTLSP